MTASATFAGSDVERVRVDVDEHGAGAGELDDVRGRGKRVRGNDHLVTRADAEREDTEVERRGAGRDDRGVRRSDRVRQRALELVDLRAHRELPAREHLGHSSELGLADVRSRQPDRLGQARGRPEMRPVPRDRPRKAVVEVDLRLEAEQAPRLVDVRDA